MDVSIGAEGALLSALLDESHECIKLLDERGTILFVNREGCRAMELSTPDDVIGLSLLDRWPDEARAEVKRALDEARSDSPARFSAARPGPHGETRWWDVTLTPVASGGTARFVSIARDMTAEVVERERAAAIGAEMRHRIRNGMTIAAGILTLEARAAPEHRAFADQVAVRFHQLAHVQEMILDNEAEKSLNTVLPLLSQVYGGGSFFRIADVPDVRLSDAATQALALTIGELATNSLKYGALSRGEPIDLVGLHEGDVLQLTWREVTQFGTPREGAQGFVLAARLLAGLGGAIAREEAGGTLVVRITLPLAG